VLRYKVSELLNFGWDFPTEAKTRTVFGVVERLKVIFAYSDTQKALPWPNRRRFAQSTVGIGSGVYADGDHKNKKGKGRDR